jgi:hypothetical protein
MVSSPKPPNPYDTAAAQTQSNIAGATANAIIGNANEKNPYGSVTYNNIGYDYITDSKGKQTAVPRYERNVQLSPEQQNLLNLQNQMQANLGQLGVSQSGRLQDLLGTNLGTEGLPGWENYAKAPDLKTGYAGAGDTEAAFSGDRKRVEDALMARWRSQNDPAMQAQETQLAARGLSPGSAMWGSTQDAQNRARTDATYGAIAAGGQEQSRLLGEARTAADFFNTGTQQNWQNMNAWADMQNNLRGAQLGERQTLRNAPINEISALMSGSQVSVPQFQPFNAPNVATTPIGQYINENYNQRLKAAQATNTGLFGLGTSLMGGLFGAGGGLAPGGWFG